MYISVDGLVGNGKNLEFQDLVSEISQKIGPHATKAPSLYAQTGNRKQVYIHTH